MIRQAIHTVIIQYCIKLSVLKIRRLLGFSSSFLFKAMILPLQKYLCLACAQETCSFATAHSWLVCTVHIPRHTKWHSCCNKKGGGILNLFSPLLFLYLILSLKIKAFLDTLLSLKYLKYLCTYILTIAKCVSKHGFLI